MSMYASYVRERLGDEVLETDKGFATYRYIKEGGVDAVYIVDLFVKTDFRKENVASEMADMIVEAAKAVGCKRLIGTVNPSAKNATTSLKVLLGYGMELHWCTQDTITFKKEL